MYCSSTWIDSTVTSMKKLKIAYNNGLGGLLNFPKYNSTSEMFVNLNSLSFGEQLRKSVFSFRTRIINLDNSLVHGDIKTIIRITINIYRYEYVVMMMIAIIIIILLLIMVITVRQNSNNI